jgi:acyl carrier protein
VRPGVGSADIDTDLVATRAIDSLAFVEVVYAVEERTGRDIDLENVDARKLRTVRGIAELFFADHEPAGDDRAEPPADARPDPGSASVAATTDGLFALDHDAVTIVEEVDAAIVAWARERGARSERHADLVRPADLDRMSYFDSFPHLAHRVTPWQDETGEEAPLALTSAACYPVYFARTGTTPTGGLELVTVRAVCRRRETHYEPLRRQREFQMREVVAVGDAPDVEVFLEQAAAFLEGLAARFGIPAGLEVATDPFFRKDDPRLVAQRLFPTKRELVDDTGLAIGSVNYHRNFFGECCAIDRDGTPAHTACVAFGLERWVDAVRRHRPGAPPAPSPSAPTSTPKDPT